MKKRPTKPNERVIPIHVEGRDSPPPANDEEEVAANSDETAADSSAEVAVCPLDTFDLTLDPENDSEPAVERSLPYWNSKEKIVLVIDRAEDDNCTHFKLNSGSLPPLTMVKRAVELFLHSKHFIGKQHEYALALMNENSATLALDFTSDIGEVLRAVQEVTSCEAEDIYDLNALFEVLPKDAEVPREADLAAPPPHVLRTILFYGRSYTLPELKVTPEISRLLEAPYFTFDVLMTHEPEGIDNNCGRIFDVLQNLDKKGFAYFFSVGRSTKILHNSVGKLLSHPLQRPVQKLADYTLKSD